MLRENGGYGSQHVAEQRAVVHAAEAVYQVGVFILIGLVLDRRGVFEDHLRGAALVQAHREGCFVEPVLRDHVQILVHHHLVGVGHGDAVDGAVTHAALQQNVAEQLVVIYSIKGIFAYDDLLRRLVGGFIRRLVSGLIRRLVGGLVGGLVRRLIGGLIRRLIGGLIRRLVGGLVGRLVGGLVGGLVRRLVGGLICRLIGGLVGGLVRRFIRRLIGGLVDRLIRRLIRRLIGGLVSRFVCRFVAGLIRHFINRFVRRFVAGLIRLLIGELFRHFVGGLVRRLVGILVRRLVGCFFRCIVGSLVRLLIGRLFRHFVAGRVRRLVGGLFCHFVAGRIRRLVNGFVRHFVSSLVRRLVNGFVRHFVSSLVRRLVNGFVRHFVSGLVRRLVNGFVRHFVARRLVGVEHDGLHGHDELARVRGLHGAEDEQIGARLRLPGHGQMLAAVHGCVALGATVRLVVHHRPDAHVALGGQTQQLRLVHEQAHLVLAVQRERAGHLIFDVDLTIYALKRHLDRVGDDVLIGLVHLFRFAVLVRLGVRRVLLVGVRLLVRQLGLGVFVRLLRIGFALRFLIAAFVRFLRGFADSLGGIRIGRIALFAEDDRLSRFRARGYLLRQRAEGHAGQQHRHGAEHGEELGKSLTHRRYTPFYDKYFDNDAFRGIIGSDSLVPRGLLSLHHRNALRSPVRSLARLHVVLNLLTYCQD